MSSLKNIFRQAQEFFRPATWEPKLVEDKENASPQPDASASREIFAACLTSPTPYAFRYLIQKAPHLHDYVLWQGQKPVSPWQQRMAGAVGVLSSSPEFGFRNNLKSLPTFWMFEHDTLSDGYQATKSYIPSSVDMETGAYWNESHTVAVPASNSDARNAAFLAHELRHAEQELAKLAPTYKQTPATSVEMSLALEADAMAYALRVLWTIPDKFWRESILLFPTKDSASAPLVKAFSAVMEHAPTNEPLRRDILDRATENALRAFYEAPVAKMYVAIYLSLAQKMEQAGDTGSEEIPSDFYKKLVLTADGHPYAADSEIPNLAQQTIKRSLRDFSAQKGRGTSLHTL